MRFVKAVFRSLFLCLLVVAAFAGYRHYFGKHIGEPCANSNDCAELLNVQCMQDITGSYCSRPCRIQTDCPSDWRCVTAHAPDGSQLAEMVCTRIGATTTAAPSSPRPSNRRH